ncbi:MAG: 5-formyltetrahydrofolate cyclo-ligase [Clostridia bacterium]|nr:5-formyltetrahydrofolate cyclo-ligase [Clostridia bacterium]
MRARRASMAPAERASRSRRIARFVLELPDVRRATWLFAFLSKEDEVDTGPLLLAARRAGLRLAAPVVRPGRRLAWRELAWPEDPDAREPLTVPGRFGIREPDPAVSREVAPEVADIVLVPGLAFDERGHRLGYGGGYYDRFLASWRARGGPRGALAVGLAFACQIVSRIPEGPWDEPVDVVVTEAGVRDLRFQGGRS